ncbi:MAG: RNA polymerase sigma factor [Calditrichaeota bacterium]|nr:RNA polymerase sigma factor [Calditrichota bacterium]
MSLTCVSIWAGSRNKADVAKEPPNKDSALLQGCRRGDRQAQRALYDQYKDWVFGIAYRMSNHQQQAEDITQEVFIRLFRKIDSFRGDSAFSSWLYRLAMNVCINHLKKEKKYRERILNELSNSQNQNTSFAKGEKPTFDMKPYLEKAIRALPEGYRAVFVLYQIEGYGHREIARMLNISEGTSKSQLHKARLELRKFLEPYISMHQSF